MRTQTTSIMLTRALTIALVLALLASCGGNPTESLIEAAGNAAGADIDDLDFDDDGSFSVSVGDAEVAFGGAGGRPEWLEPEFVLPEGIQVQIAIDDPSTGERAIYGSIENGDAEAILGQQAATLTAAGYEQLGDNHIFLAPGKPPIEIAAEAADGSVYFTFEHLFEDEQTLRDIYAAVEGYGSMAVTIGDDRYLVEGRCTLRSTSGQFWDESEIGEPAGSATVELRDGEQNYVLADVTTIDGETMGLWSILQVDDSGNYPSITVDDRGFSIEGQMTNLADGTTESASVGVSCPG